MGNETIDKKLRFLFGFQRFMQDPELKEIIDETENRMNVVRLSDMDLMGVSAGVNNPGDENGESCYCVFCQKSAVRLRLPNGMYKCTNCQKEYYDQ